MIAPYPLESVRALRAHEEDAALETLRAREAAFEIALQTEHHHESMLEVFREESERLRMIEQERDRGGRSLSEMLLARAYLEGRERGASELQLQLENARAESRHAQAAVENARAQLVEARASREAVEKHRQKWAHEISRKDEAKIEAEAEDVLAHRNRSA